MNRQHYLANAVLWAIAIVTKGELPFNESTMAKIATVKLVFVSLFIVRSRLFGRETNASRV